MNYNWIVLYFISFFNLTKALSYFKNTVLKPLTFKNNEPKEEYVIYIEDWSCGEIQWEFAQNDEQKIYTILTPKKGKIEIYEKDFKKNMKNSLSLSSGFIKAVYEDTFNIESIANKLQNIDYSHLGSESSMTGLFTFSIISLIYYGYKKSIETELNILQNQRKMNKEITLEEIKSYIKMQRIIKTFILSFIFIFTKNIKDAD